MHWHKKYKPLKLHVHAWLKSNNFYKGKKTGRSTKWAVLLSQNVLHTNTVRYNWLLCCQNFIHYLEVCTVCVHKRYVYSADIFAWSFPQNSCINNYTATSGFNSVIISVVVVMVVAALALALLAIVCCVCIRRSRGNRVEMRRVSTKR